MTPTKLYTDLMRTSATTLGHMMEIAGAGAEAAGCPFAPTVRRVGEAIASQAARSCERDTPALTRCNHPHPRRNR